MHILLSKHTIRTWKGLRSFYERTLLSRMQGEMLSLSFLEKNIFTNQREFPFQTSAWWIWTSAVNIIWKPLIWRSFHFRRMASHQIYSNISILIRQPNISSITSFNMSPVLNKIVTKIIEKRILTLEKRISAIIVSLSSNVSCYQYLSRYKTGIQM